MNGSGNLELNSYLLHSAVEEISKNSPNDIAVKYQDFSLNYRELNQKANQLACCLIKNGIKVGDYVGISLERNASVIISILAVLKTGAAYVPLDPNHPESRLLFMIEDSGIELIISDSKSKVVFDKKTVSIIDLDIDKDINLLPNRNPDIELQSENIAYIIYTSGSTGQPKGVKVTHKNVLRLFTSTEELFEFNKKDVWTLFHSYSFDFSVWEIWGALLYGGKLVVVSHLTSRSPNEFYELLLNESVTVLNQTPTAFLQLQRVDKTAVSDKGNLSLKYIIFGGEKLNVKSLSPWIEKYGDRNIQLFNMYGITETTVHVTYKKVDKEDVERNYNSIGVPIKDLKVYIVDKKMRPVPKGLVGELLIGGAGVTEGYHNLPELTKNKFIEHPNKKGEKLYRSGDLGKYHNNGEIEYLGRIDNQVKVRGFRIELGDIEKNLIDHPDIEEAVATVETADLGEKNIVSYVVVASNKKVQTDDLRKYLKSKLPEYMVPNIFVTVAKIPLTHNGKVDYTELSKIQIGKLQHLNQEKVEPRNDLERKLCKIWVQTLKHSSIGIDDNFFDLGGHSLSVSKMIWIIKEELNVSIPVKFVFNNPTIRELSNYIVSENTMEVASNVNSQIKKRKDLKTYPMSYAQKGIWFQEQLLGINNAYNMCVPLKLTGNLDIKHLYTSFLRVVARHETLRANFTNEFGIPEQSISNTKSIDFETIKIQGTDKVNEFIESTCVSPFELKVDPKLRVRVVEVSEKQYVLILVLHHISGDAQSLTNLLNEVSSIYNSLIDKTEPNIPLLDIQYSDFANWQHQWLESEEFKEQVAFWKNKLKDAPSYLDLKADFPRQSGVISKGNSITFEIESELSRMIRRAAREHDLTLYMFFMSAWKVLLSKYTGQTDIVIGSNISTRNPDLENLIGLFVNTVPIRTSVDQDKDIKAIFEETKQTTLDAFSNQDIPFELLLSELKVERDPVRPALCQVFLSYQSKIDFNDSMKDVKVELLPDTIPMIPYDMAVEIYDDSPGISGTLQYNENLFLPSTVQSMINDYLTILEQIAENPDAIVKELFNKMKIIS